MRNLAKASFSGRKKELHASCQGSPSCCFEQNRGPSRQSSTQEFRLSWPRSWKQLSSERAWRQVWGRHYLHLLLLNSPAQHQQMADTMEVIAHQAELTSKMSSNPRKSNTWPHYRLYRQRMPFKMELIKNVTDNLRQPDQRMQSWEEFHLTEILSSLPSGIPPSPTSTLEAKRASPAEPAYEDIHSADRPAD